MTAKHLELGKTGEDVALAHYLDSGYQMIARNWRCRVGELDLILSRDDVLVFCEVKTRRGTAHGGGFAAVTGIKQAKLRSLAELFMMHTGRWEAAARFDVASVLLSDGDAAVDIFEDAF